MPSRVPPGTYAIAITTLAVAIASVAAWRERPTDAASRQGLGEAIDATARTVAARRPTAIASAPVAPSAVPTIGAPRFDQQGRLLPDPPLRHFLDRYLTAVDAQAVAAQRQGLERDLAAMPAAQVAQVLSWFDRYATYLQAEAAASRGADPERQAQQSRALRERLLGPRAASALFADEAATR